MSPCQCSVCVMSRRKKELLKAPTIEGCISLVNDIFTVWLNEDLDSSMAVLNAEKELENAKSRFADLERLSASQAEALNRMEAGQL